MVKIREFWNRCWDEDDAGKASDSVFSILTRVVVTVAVFVFFDRALEWVAVLPVESYNQTTIFLPFWSRLFHGWNLLFLLPLALFSFWFYRNGPKTWTGLRNGSIIRLVAISATAVLTWRFVTLDHNLFFDQSYYADRVLLLFFAALIWFRPIFLLPFLVTLLPVINQLEALPGYSTALASVPINLLLLATSVLFVFSLNNKSKKNEFFFIAICFVAAHYWYSGTGKIRIQWILHDFVPYMLPATYANGWLSFFAPPTISKLVGILTYFNLPIKVLTLLFEAGAVFSIWRKNLARVFLLGWALFHIGIFFVSGIFFWMWIIIDLTLFAVLLGKETSAFNAFSLKRALIGTALIICGFMVLKPVRLAWFDAPFTYTYRFEAETSDGQKTPLPPGFFAPYDYQFTLGNFGFINKEPILSVTWGAVAFGPASMKALDVVDEPTFIDYEREYSQKAYDPQKTMQLDLFLKRFLKNYNARGDNAAITDYLKAPPNLWTFPGDADLPANSKIVNLNVYRVTSLYNGGDYREIRKIKVHNVVVTD